MEGRDLRDGDIDQMWALRAQFMTLKPDVTPAADLAALAAWVRAPGGTVAVARDRHGAIQVFIDMNALSLEHRGRSYLLCYGHYVYASTAYRHHPAYTIGNFMNLFAQLRRNRVWPNRRVLWLGPVYLSSFIVGAKTFPEYWVAGEPSLPSEAAELLDKAAPAIFGADWMPSERLVRLPITPRPYATRSRESIAELARYEARNPRWKDGYGVLIAVPLTLGNILGPMRLAVTRMLRRAGSRRSS